MKRLDPLNILLTLSNQISAKVRSLSLLHQHCESELSNDVGIHP